MEQLRGMRPLLAIACAFAIARSAAGERFLVRDGAPEAEIVIAKAAPRMTRIAARELQAHIEKISGGRLDIVTRPTGKVPVRVLVGDSPQAKAVGVTSEGLDWGAFHMKSGADWLALVGNDADFVPIEPWARNRGNWLRQKRNEWDKLTGAKWSDPMGASMYKDYSGRAATFGRPEADKRGKSGQIEFWRFDKRGSPNAVYEFLRGLGVRWYMPGELGTIVPRRRAIALPEVNKTVVPDVAVRTMSWDRYHAISREQLLWSLRLGLNKIPAPMHHGIANVTRRAEQRKRRPEIYQVRRGKRDVESRRPKACLSSPELFKQNVRFVRTMMDHYKAPVVSVMPQDGFTVICQCPLCKPRATPERGSSGRFSDYVWDYVNRVAAEVARTHPKGKIICGAYSTYQLPPLRIGKLHPNVLVQITNGRPRNTLDPGLRKELNDLHRAWMKKTDNPLSITINYHMGYAPFYHPHVIARGLSDAKGRLWREDLWFMPFSRTGLYKPGVCHLNVYLTSRLWWDQDLNVEALLAEYYRLYYGPAAKEMETFVSFVEQNYQALTQDKEKVNRCLDLFEVVKAKVSPDTVYGRRIALVDDYLAELRKRKKQLGKGRENMPVFRSTIDMSKDKWRKARKTLKLDGKLDEPFWTAYPHGGRLRELLTGRKPVYPTTFLSRWYRDGLYLGIRCQDTAGHPANIAGAKDGDWALWDGDHVEILIETAEHAYYQIVVNPAGARIELDRGVRKKGWFNWSSQAEVAAHVGADYWSVEIRIPVTSSTDDPLHQVIGRRPTAAMPWFFNICRKRVRGQKVEVSAFSPTGKRSFHVTNRFAKMYLR